MKSINHGQQRTDPAIYWQGIKWFLPVKDLKQRYLSCLHLLSSPPKGNIRVVVGGAIPLFLFDLRDERWSSAILTLSYPVVIYSLNKVVILIQQQFSFLKCYKLKENIQKVQLRWGGAKRKSLTCLLHFLNKLDPFPAKQRKGEKNTDLNPSPQATSWSS